MSDYQNYIHLKTLNNTRFISMMSLSQTLPLLWKMRLIIFFTPAVIFLLTFITMLFLTEHIKKETELLTLPPSLYPSYRPVLYPVTGVFSSEDVASFLTAEGSIVMDSESKVILFSKNMDKIFPMASTTKIMSALVAIETFGLNDVITIRSADSPPAIVGYSIGEKMKMTDILYGMFLPSGNDAALALAQNYPGGERAFVNAMNMKAKQLSLHNTHFADSSGLNSNNSTTPRDLAHLASEAMRYKLLRDIVSTKQKRTPNLANTKTYSLNNINELLGKYHVNGIKTGFTEEAGGVLVTSTTQQGHTVVIVIMKSNDRFGDTEKILSRLNQQITYVSIGQQ